MRTVNKSTAAAFSLIFIFSTILLGQTNDPASEWKLLQHENSGYKVLVPWEPEGNALHTKKNRVRNYSWDRDGTKLFLQETQRSSDKDFVPSYIKWAISWSAKCNTSDKENYFSVHCSFSDSFFNYEFKLINTLERFVEVIGYGPVKDPKDFIAKFVRSLELTDEPPTFKEKRSNLDARKILRQELTAGTLLKKGVFTREHIQSLTAQPKKTFGEPSRISSRLLLNSKTEPGYNVAARSLAILGSVRLKMTFFADGRVTVSEVVEPLPFGLTEDAVKAALRIQFEPAVRNGRRISVRKTVVFNFQIYGITYPQVGNNNQKNDQA